MTHSTFRKMKKKNKIVLYSWKKSLLQKLKGSPPLPLLRRELRFLRERVSGDYKCDICSYVVPFRGKTKLFYKFETHLREHETSTKLFRCSKCPEHPGFSGNQLFQMHKSFHQRQFRIWCDHCGKSFDPIELPKHLLECSKNESIIQCSLCSYCCSTDLTYRHHVREFHLTNPICHLCSEKFESHPDFLTHLHEKHQQIEKIICDICGTPFLSLDYLYRHKWSSHQVAGSHTCKECGAGFKIPGRLKFHMIAKHGAPPRFTCDQCGKLLSSAYTLRRHWEIVHQGLGITCKQCGEIFVNESRWRLHIDREHGPPEKLICSFCSKKYSTRMGLKSHMMMTHTGDTRQKKFTCSYCPKAFTMRKYRDTHQFIHTGEKPYICSDCGIAYNNIGSLHAHKKRCVKEDPPPPETIPEVGSGSGGDTKKDGISIF